MNRRQKLVQRQFLNNEQAIIKRLNQVYGQALKDVNRNIEALMKRFDPETGDLPQSAIYQLKYQNIVKDQLEGILNQMQTKQFTNISDYLDTCYEDGFVGGLFDLHGQGVPLMMPLNQEAMVTAVQLDSKISQGLYTRLGEDVGLLKKKITAQVSRSIATGTSFSDCAKQLTGYTRIGYNNAIRIARTEGHRIQNQANMDTMEQAKERGADVVKQWDSTLDGKTRESHVAVDGEIRELNEKFSNGLMFPGDPSGPAAEVINCRCRALQRARWAVGDGFTKWNNFTRQVESFESPESYDEFKKAFFSAENKRYMNYVQQMEKKYGTRDWATVLDRMTTREYNYYSKLLANNPTFNAMIPVTDAVSIDQFPLVFRKNAQGKKATKVFADALSGVERLDPNIYKLYTNMDGLPNIPDDNKISYTSRDHALKRWGSRSTGETSKCVLNVPKMEGEDLMGQKATAFHEIAHFIDMGSGNKNKLLSELRSDLTDAVRASGKTIPSNIQRMFDDFAVQYNRVVKDVRTTYNGKRTDLNNQYKSGKLSWTDYRKQWKALTREEELEADYQKRNIGGGGITMLSDIYDALSGGTYRDNGTLLYGHGARYYHDPGNQNCEIFANYMSLSVNRPDLVDLLRDDKPELCSTLDQIIAEMAGGIK